MNAQFSFASLPDSPNKDVEQGAGNTDTRKANHIKIDHGNAFAVQCEDHLDEHFNLFNLIEFREEFENHIIRNHQDSKTPSQVSVQLYQPCAISTGHGSVVRKSEGQQDREKSLSQFGNQQLEEYDSEDIGSPLHDNSEELLVQVHDVENNAKAQNFSGEGTPSVLGSQVSQSKEEAPSKANLTGQTPMVIISHDTIPKEQTQVNDEVPDLSTFQGQDLNDEKVDTDALQLAHQKLRSAALTKRQHAERVSIASVKVANDLAQFQKSQQNFLNQTGKGGNIGKPSASVCIVPNMDIKTNTSIGQKEPTSPTQYVAKGVTQPLLDSAAKTELKQQLLMMQSSAGFSGNTKMKSVSGRYIMNQASNDMSVMTSRTWMGGKAQLPPAIFDEGALYLNDEEEQLKNQKTEKVQTQQQQQQFGQTGKSFDNTPYDWDASQPTQYHHPNGQNSHLINLQQETESYLHQTKLSQQFKQAGVVLNSSQVGFANSQVAFAASVKSSTFSGRDSQGTTTTVAGRRERGGIYQPQNGGRTAQIVNDMVPKIQKNLGITGARNRIIQTDLITDKILEADYQLIKYQLTSEYAPQNGYSVQDDNLNLQKSLTKQKKRHQFGSEVNAMTFGLKQEMSIQSMEQVEITSSQKFIRLTGSSNERSLGEKSYTDFNGEHGTGEIDLDSSDANIVVSANTGQSGSNLLVRETTPKNRTHRKQPKKSMNDSMYGSNILASSTQYFDRDTLANLPPIEREAYLTKASADDKMKLPYGYHRDDEQLSPNNQNRDKSISWGIGIDPTALYEKSSKQVSYSQAFNDNAHYNKYSHLVSKDAANMRWGSPTKKAYDKYIRNSNINFHQEQPSRHPKQIHYFDPLHPNHLPYIDQGRNSHNQSNQQSQAILTPYLQSPTPNLNQNTNDDTTNVSQDNLTSLQQSAGASFETRFPKVHRNNYNEQYILGQSSGRHTRNQINVQSASYKKKLRLEIDRITKASQLDQLGFSTPKTTLSNLQAAGVLLAKSSSKKPSTKARRDFEAQFDKFVLASPSANSRDSSGSRAEGQELQKPRQQYLIPQHPNSGGPGGGANGQTSNRRNYRNVNTRSQLAKSVNLLDSILKPVNASALGSLAFTQPGDSLLKSTRGRKGAMSGQLNKYPGITRSKYL